ncbi:MAG: hypothetical protein IMZ61_11810 [Planctomycetes bacterium]|nr:hypothetical protein [Planctomycetota bacterium]
MTISLQESDKPRQTPLRYFRRRYVILSLSLMVILGVAPFVSTLRRTAALRELTAVAAHVPDSELAKAVPCARAPLVDENDRAALIDALGKLDDPQSRATAFCLLGDAAGASAEYQQAARAGDSWSALQAYYLLAKSGDLDAAGRILDETHLSEKDLLVFFNSVTWLDPSFDLLPLARKMVESDPANPDGWKAWLEVGARYSRLQDWPKALDVYRQAMSAKGSLGVQVGRSNFALSTGRIYQGNLDPRQLETALSYVDHWNLWMDFIILLKTIPTVLSGRGAG